MKKVAILYTNYSPVIDAIKYQLSDCEVDCFTSQTDMSKYDLVILSDYCGVYEGEALKCHYSLLPAFNTTEPVKDAILSGVKVTGITIYYSKSEKIVTQYPIFIHNDTHFEELEQELKYVEQTVFPPVIQKILNNEPFEIKALLNKTSCSGNCGGKYIDGSNFSGGCCGCNH